MAVAGTVEAAALARELIRCPSVTPADAGAIGVLEGALQGLGFATHRLVFREDGSPEIANLYARWGRGGPNFCFAGHTDVVPVGDRAAWSVDPFAGTVTGNVLYGRGACDMKGAVAAFVDAAGRFLARRSGTFQGSISLLVTGDEEGPAINGTRKVLAWLEERGETLDACLVGEPTATEAVADTIKIGRRGSLNGRLTVYGAQGHTAYPHLADNPIPRLVATLGRLAGTALDEGTAHFQSSTLQITTVDVGNPATNVIPAEARAAFNIRFNDRHTGASLKAWLAKTCEELAGAHRLDVGISGESFLTPPSRLADLVARAAERVTGHRPAFSTTGGTSDARFIKDVCPVAELGLVGRTMHKVDEQVPLADLARLTDVYEAVLDEYFAG